MTEGLSVVVLTPFPWRDHCEWSRNFDTYCDSGCTLSELSVLRGLDGLNELVVEFVEGFERSEWVERIDRSPQD